MITQAQLSIIKDINKIIDSNRNDLMSCEIIEIMEYLLKMYQSELDIFGEIK